MAIIIVCIHLFNDLTLKHVYHDKDVVICLTKEHDMNNPDKWRVIHSEHLERKPS